MVIIMSKIRVPSYSLGEELINSISHGIGALLSIVALVLMIIKANNPLQISLVSICGTSMVILYTISCIYHALSPKIKGKIVLRVLDHCNVFLLVYTTYMVFTLLAIGGILGIILLILSSLFTIIGIIFSAINVDKYSLVSTICHLVVGWSSLIGIKYIYTNIGFYGTLFLILGGIMFSVGAALYGLGKRKKYMHSIFHFFCIAGSILHFISIYFYLL